MTSTNTTRDLEQFLQSDAFRATNVAAESARPIVERFHAACASMETEPRFLDAGGMHGVVGHVLPDHFAVGDPLGEHVEAVLAAYVAFLDAPMKKEQLASLADVAPAAAHAIATGEAHHHHHGEEVELPYVREMPKVGRNEPCPCGSGKKFKACHGRA